MIVTPADNVAATTARLVIGGFFAISGANNLLTLNDTIAQAVAVGIPLAVVLIPLVALLKMLFGILICVKFHTKVSALYLSIYIALSTLLFYAPWTWTTNPQSEIVFTRNMAILSGLLLLYAHSRGLARLRSNEASRLGRHVTKEEWEKRKAVEKAV